MATYSELYQIIGYEVEGALVLRNKVAIAALVTADTITSGGDDVAPFDQTAGAHDQRVKWAEMAYQGNQGLIDQVFRAVIAANASMAQATILAASDAAIQANVNAVVDTLAANL